MDYALNVDIEMECCTLHLVACTVWDRLLLWNTDRRLFSLALPITDACITVALHDEAIPHAVLLCMQAMRNFELKDLGASDQDYLCALAIGISRGISGMQLDDAGTVTWRHSIVPGFDMANHSFQPNATTVWGLRTSSLRIALQCNPTWSEQMQHDP